MPDWASPLKRQGEIASRASLLVGVDVDSAITEHPLIHHRVMAFGSKLPFKDSSFDVVTANMVMEHVDDPAPFLTEIRRILRPDGRFIFVTPNARYWAVAIAAKIPDGLKKRIIKVVEAREAHDVFPTHYRANTEPDVRKLAAAVALKIDKIDAVGPYPLFARFPALAAVEGLFLRVLKTRPQWRSNYVVSLQK